MSEPMYLSGDPYALEMEIDEDEQDAIKWSKVDEAYDDFKERR